MHASPRLPHALSMVTRTPSTYYFVSQSPSPPSPSPQPRVLLLALLLLSLLTAPPGPDVKDVIELCGALSPLARCAGSRSLLCARRLPLPEVTLEQDDDDRASRWGGGTRTR